MANNGKVWILSKSNAACEDKEDNAHNQHYDCLLVTGH